MSWFFVNEESKNQIFRQQKLTLFIFPPFLGLDARLTCFCMCTYLQDPAIFAPQNNPPCPTLFVANLGQTVSDRELTDVFSRYGLIKTLWYGINSNCVLTSFMFSCEGFIKLKMQNKSGAPVAFVDFKVSSTKLSFSLIMIYFICSI